MSKISFVPAVICALMLGSSAYGQCCDSGVVIDSSPVVYSSPVYTETVYTEPVYAYTSAVYSSPVYTTSYRRPFNRRWTNNWTMRRPVYANNYIEWVEPVIYTAPVIVEQPCC